VNYLAKDKAKDKGVTQFLDVGTGIATSPNVHETAAACAEDTRVVYADNDPLIHAHANALLTGTGTTRIIVTDRRDPDVILAGAWDFLDFTRPVALLLVAILHFIPDGEDPAGIVAAFRDALPPGSFLALSHGTAHFHPAEVTGTATSAYDAADRPAGPATPYRHRGVPGRLHDRAPGPGPGPPLAPGHQPQAERPEEDRHLRRGRREELTARPG
jgi:hypothetical protein